MDRNSWKNAVISFTFYRDATAYLAVGYYPLHHAVVSFEDVAGFAMREYFPTALWSGFLKITHGQLSLQIIELFFHNIRRWASFI